MDFSLVSDPLFASIITFCTLILLYLPNFFFRIVFSPILISTSVLLFSLLRLGASQRSTQNNTPESINTTKESINELIIEDYKWVSDFSESPPECESKKKKKMFYSDSFVEWDVRAPLEVIYEELEGEIEEEEEEQNDGVLEGKREAQMAIIERYASLSKFYPETDSDISSEEDFLGIRDWDSQENTVSFNWEREEKEGLIEIELGQKMYCGGCEVEEDDNLIEIDLYPVR